MDVTDTSDADSATSAWLQFGWLVLASCELDERCRTLVQAVASGADRSARVTLGTLGELFAPDHRGALTVASNSALRRAAFVDVTPGGAWADQAIVVHPSVIWALLGDTSPDADLSADVEMVDIAASTQFDHEADAPLVVVNGTDRMRRRQAGMHRSVGTRFIAAPAPSTEVGWAALVREATISGRGLVIELGEQLDSSGRRWIERATHLAWVLSAVSGPAVDELPHRHRVDIDAPAHGPSDAEWSAILGEDIERTHRLTFDQLDRVGRAAQGISRPGESLSTEQVDAAIRRLASGRLDQLTSRVRPTRTWSDLIIRAENLELLHGITIRYEQSTRVYDDWGFTATPSRGLVALFSGPSGTGKTLASEIIAGELGLDLFKLDLSSVVSKYIGETEKNLEKIFDAASAGNLVLFFDEADALFGKRSEVKDSRDRYANLEVSYLLQRLERYDGLVIMATNFEKNIDDAFLRRIHVRVPFTLPEAEERAEIWRSNFPEHAPVGKIDFGWLAERFSLSGGAIRNAAVHAAFHAAAHGDEITMSSVVTGVAHEFRKMGRLVQPADFGEYHDVVDG